MKKTLSYLFIGLSIALSSCADNTKINFVDSLESPIALPTPLISQTVSDKQNNDTNQNKEKVSIKFKTGIIKNSGSIVPVARQDFIIRKYDFHKFHNAYLLSRNTSNKPSFEKDFKYNVNIDAGNISEQVKSLTNLFQLNLKTWYDEVYSDFKNQLSKYSKDKSIIVKSDLSGEFTADLEQETTYYISGEYIDSNSQVNWLSVEFKADANKKIELSNDNGVIRESIKNNPRRSMDIIANDLLLDDIFSSLKDL